MKTKILFAIAFMLIVFSTNAQTDSKGFRFQGFAETPEGEVLKLEAVTVKFTIYPKTGTGFIFEEIQDQITNAYGIFYAEVGEMNPDDLQKINFTAKGADYWMKVEVKKTTSGVYATISDTELLATPYARHAANGVPVGTIISFAGSLNKIPEGWLLCNGEEYDGSDPNYIQLYNVIGTNWGGSGQTFNVPELRGNFLRGLDNGAGNDSDASTRTAINTGGNEGDKVGSFQTDTIGNHLHSLSGNINSGGNHSHSFVVYGGQLPIGGKFDYGDNARNNNFTGPNTPLSQAGDHQHDIEGDTDNAGGEESRPKNVYVAYIIKY